MIESGLLTKNDRVELLEGRIVDKMSQNPPHGGTVTHIGDCLTKLAAEKWYVRIQCPITLNKSEPEPDLAVVPRSRETWLVRHPYPEDIEIVIEVADSTVLTDRREKGALYAAAGIREFWLVNLVSRKLEVYTKPKAGKSAKYGHCREYKKNETVPLVLGGKTVAELAVSELIP